jgi:hypothetical protein
LKSHSILNPTSILVGESVFAMTMTTWIERLNQQAAIERWLKILNRPIPQGAYSDVAERQAQREMSQLSDRSHEIEADSSSRGSRSQLAVAFGNFIAYELGKWDWFVNPISFRDRHPDLERNRKTGRLRRYRIVDRVGGISVCVADPRLKSWEPNFRGRVEHGPPVPDKALAEIKDYLFELQEAAEQPISWMIAEEWGRVGGRNHCHLLVQGVSHLRRDEAWKKAFERFGRTKITPFDPQRGAAFYCAKYAAKQIGALHFGGSFGNEYSVSLGPGPECGRIDVTPSPQMAREEIRRSEFYPRGWAAWRQKR